jgi:excisionase family DNA binding protein
MPTSDTAAVRLMPTPDTTPAGSVEEPRTAPTGEELRDRPEACVEPLLTAREAAAFLRISERSLWQFAKDGDVRSIRFGRSLRYDKRDLLAFIDAMKS